MYLISLTLEQRRNNMSINTLDKETISHIQKLHSDDIDANINTESKYLYFSEKHIEIIQ